MSTLKKTLIASIVFFVLAVLIAVYFLFVRNTVEETPPTDQTAFPFGGEADPNQTPVAPTLEQDQFGNDIIPLASLMNLSSQPVAGAYTLQIGSSTVVRYNLRSSGHIIEVNLNSGTTSKLFNTTIPKIQESFWFARGNRTLIRYANDTGTSITTYNASLIASSTSASSTPTLSGVFMPSNIASVSISPTTNEFFYLVEEINGSRGYIADSTGSKRVTVFISPLSEWATQWAEASIIALTTKPSYSVAGYLYFLNPKTGAFKKIIGDVPGLTTVVNTTGELVAYSNNILNLSIYNIKSKQAVTTNLKTLPEKCVWSRGDTNILYCAAQIAVPRGNFPDEWYQGKVSFKDEIYRIDTKNQQYKAVSTLSESYTNPIDAINLSISPNGNYIIFTNKIDGSLWSQKISQ